MAQLSGTTTKPLGVQTFTVDLPLGTVIHGVTDDGVDMIVAYTVQPNARQAQTKTRTFEVVAESTVLNEDGRTLLGYLSDGTFFYENTENTLPDDLVP